MRKLEDLLADLNQSAMEIPLANKAALTFVGQAIENQVKDMIGTKQSFWADLKPSTIDRKRRAGWGRGGDPASPLWATGEYQRSVEWRLTGSNAVRISSDLDFVQYLEYGSSRMPPRPVFLPATKIVLRNFLGTNRLNQFYFRELR